MTGRPRQRIKAITAAGRGHGRFASFTLAAVLAGLLLTGANQPARAAGGTVEFAGGGWGHGLGMSQWGARGYAAAGTAYADILRHFYTGVTVDPVAENDNPIRIGLQWDASLVSGSTSVGGTAQCPGSSAVSFAAGSWSFAAVPVSGGYAGQFRRSDGSEIVHCSNPITVTYLPGTLSTTGHSYHHGTLEFSVRPSTALVRSIAVISSEGSVPAMDVYLYGLGEMPSSWPADALKAQAVAGRTYALEKLHRVGEHRTSPACDCGIVASTLDQAYVGYDKETASYGSSWTAAVDATRFIAINYQGSLIAAYYHSSDGGSTENNENEWGGTAVPYLRGVGDPYDGTGGNPNFRWTVRMSWSDLQARLNGSSSTSVGTLSNISVVSPVGVSGRVTVVTSSTQGGVRIDGSNGTKRVSGETLQAVLGLKSTLFTINTDVAPVDTKTTPSGGYALRGDGGLVPFGGAPAATGAPSFASDIARGVAIGVGRRDGYVLDGNGGIHPFNGAPVASITASWPNWDIARDLALRPDGVSGYVLDGLGGIHAFGGAPTLTGPWYNGNADVARRIALRPDGAAGYVVESNGAVHQLGSAPAVTSPSLASGRIAVGLLLEPVGDRGYVIDDAGNVMPFSAGAMPPAVAGGLAGTIGVAGRPDGASGYLVSDVGSVSAIGDALDAATTTGGSARRAAAALGGPSGYVLDGYGGLHPYGGARPATGGGYWSGWDIAARVAVGRDGTGLVMDGYGGLHPFAQEGISVPAAPTGGPYWSGWRIARDLILLPGSSSQGYILDGYGGLHAFGGAPVAHTTGYWSGWDIARRATLDPSGTGGYVLDGYGGLHPFSVGSAPLPPAVSGAGYWSGWDIARALVLTGTAQGWTLDGYGGAHPFGGATGAGSWSWSGHDAVVDGGTGGNGAVVYADRYGGLHTAPEAAPAVDGSAYWPGFDIARDTAALPG